MMYEKKKKRVEDAPECHEDEVSLDNILHTPVYSALFDLQTEKKELWRIREELVRNPTQLTPVEIAADRTLLSGHDYVTAAKLEQLDKIRVLAWDQVSGLLAEARMIQSGLRRAGL